MDIINEIVGKFQENPNEIHSIFTIAAFVMLPLSIILNYYFYSSLYYYKRFINSKEQTSSPKSTLASTPKSTQACFPKSTSIAIEKSKDLSDKSDDIQSLSDDEIIALIESKKIQAYSLEKSLNNPIRAISIRRKLCEKTLKAEFPPTLPMEHYDYSKVMGVCCENVVGYIPIPVGLAGPYSIDEKEYQVPMATTEGALVASTSRGCKAISMSGGAKTVLIEDGMTRGPCVKFPNIQKAYFLAEWLKKPHNYAVIEREFNGTSRFAKLQKVTIH